MMGILSRPLIALVLATGLALAPAAVAAQEAEGLFEGNTFYDAGTWNDDWYYDSYETGYGDEYGVDYDMYDVGEWGEDEIYSGAYDNENPGNDWYYDTYDDPGDEGWFDF